MRRLYAAKIAAAVLYADRREVAAILAALRSEELAMLAALKPGPIKRGRLRLWRRVSRRPRLPRPRRNKGGADVR